VVTNLIANRCVLLFCYLLQVNRICVVRLLRQLCGVRRAATRLLSVASHSRRQPQMVFSGGGTCPPRRGGQSPQIRIGKIVVLNKGVFCFGGQTFYLLLRCGEEPTSLWPTDGACSTCDTCRKICRAPSLFRNDQILDENLKLSLSFSLVTFLLVIRSVHIVNNLYIPWTFIESVSM